MMTEAKKSSPIPYYDATDWNFICFRCGPYDWLMQDGELHQIYQ